MGKHKPQTLAALTLRCAFTLAADTINPCFDNTILRGIPVEPEVSKMTDALGTLAISLQASAFINKELESDQNFSSVIASASMLIFPIVDQNPFPYLESSAISDSIRP